MSHAISAWRASLAAALDDLRDFDWNDLGRGETIGAWPTAVMLLLALALVTACLAAGYCFDIRSLRASVQELGAEEAGLRAELSGKAALAAGLEVQRGRVAQLEASVAALLRQLPGHSELPGLLEDISAAGLASGLKIVSVQLRNELEQEHYLELPLDIEVVGDYHGFGRFVAGVGGLARARLQHPAHRGRSVEHDDRSPHLPLQVGGGAVSRPVCLQAGLAALLGLLLAACRGAADRDGLEADIAALLEQPPGPSEPLPRLVSYQPVLYGAARLRSPFERPPGPERPATAAAAGAPAPNEERPREVLESVALGSLVMVGSLRRQGRVWALLRDEAGAVHRIGVGNYLGRNHGRVVAVSAKRIDLTELIGNGAGGWSERPASLAMAGRD